MPPSARAGDMTSHGSPLCPGPGSINVLIGGMPAWRALSDTHACPLSTPNPHVGGNVVAGSATVFINSLPAARLGDSIVEGGGPPNTILSGAPNVMIG
ncbi:PAAR domain-containing protein [Paenibacillus spongiae]|uniref:PAAR domain-containing protein n=1 Tax=Paenibacillus spongiae TaxID=2909671 RepID=A0ABY5S0K6_9BACL|nr:PAAR domain-containing protein [Paenibacillus spongiae]UVI27386.1 PAAR domain-containing protein [Paenibacillus spongiae]